MTTVTGVRGCTPAAMITSFVLQALLAIVPVIFAITLHETAHGWGGIGSG